MHRLKFLADEPWDEDDDRTRVRRSGTSTRPQVASRSAVDDERPPICPVCGVTMVPTALSASEGHDGDWICLECEETGELD